MAGHQAIEAARRAATRAASLVRKKMSRGLGVLATIAATAPFFGLLGTCLGIVNSFKGCGCEKSAMLAAIALGLSEAVAPAALGLLIATKALVGYRYLAAQLDSSER